MDSTKHDERLAIVQSLRLLVHGLRVTAHSVERELGLTGAQLFVLGEIANEPNLSIRRVSERTLTDPSSASVVVARLLEKGLVKRRQNPVDRRTSLLSITRKGQTVLERAPEPYQAKLFAALDAMSNTRRHQLHLGLSALLDASTPSEGAAPLFFEGAPTIRAKRKTDGKTT